MKNTAHFKKMSSVLILEFKYSQQLPYRSLLQQLLNSQLIGLIE